MRALLITLLTRLHALCLRLLPRGSRQPHAGALRDTFRDRLDDVSRQGGTFRLLATGVAECADAVRHAWAMRRRREKQRMRPHQGGLSRRRTNIGQPARFYSSASLLDTLSADLRACGRAVPRRHSLSVIVALALGIGATTAVFSVVDAVLLRPLPYRESDRLVRMGSMRPRSTGVGSLTPPMWNAIQERYSGFEAAAASTGSWVTLTGAQRPQRLRAAWVSGGFFDLLGATADRGRLLGNADDDLSTDPVAVLSHDFWLRHAADNPSDADSIGDSLTVEGVNYTIVGVLDGDFVPPEGNHLSGAYDLWLPLAHADAMREPGLSFLDAVGRLDESTTPSRASSEADALGLALAEELGISERAFTTLHIAPLHDQTVGNIGGTLWTLLGAVALLLVIACANVANLMLTRANERRPEIALRAALGAGGFRIARLLLLESTLLAILGGVAGAGLAHAAIVALRTFSPANIPRLAEIGVDGRTLLFVIAVSAATGCIAGLLPAARARRADPRQAMGAGRTASGDTRHRATARAFVVVQTALALILAIGAGLLLQSFVRLYRVDLGFDADNLMRMQVNLGSVMDGSEQMQRERIAFFSILRDRVEQIPGVRTATVTNGAPFSAGGWYSSIAVLGREEGTAGGPGEELQVSRHQISGGHLSNLGLRILQGREITPTDTSGAAPVVVVNETLAQHYWPDGDALGAQVTVGGDGTFTPRTVVGIVSDARYHELETTGEPHIYLPFEQFPAFAMDVMARFDGEPARIGADMREAVWSLRGDLAIRDVSSMRDLVYADLIEPGFYTWLLASFAAVALLLAGVGVYGSVAHATAMRTREIGTRIAIGARPSATVWMVLYGAMATIAAGVMIGLAGAYATTRLLGSLLYEVETTDGGAYAVAALVVIALGLVAAYVPARRAMKVDPIVALRSE